ncbi:MAG: hypothetical protein RR494_13680 [Vagococcus sp.]|uniref:hypothetical protein n=1 Tax=Vagococcus sp. TaxID=1933889 RepID=UPI002FC7FB88
MRKIYEKINLYIYLFVPLNLILVHHLLKKYFRMNLLNTNSFLDKSFEFVLTMLGVLLTIFGLMFTLPDNEYRKLMKKYNHDKIIFNTIFSGITSSLVFIILNFFEISIYGQEILFIIIFSEVAVSTWWIFRTLKAINS